jgi:integrase
MRRLVEHGFPVLGPVKTTAGRRDLLSLGIVRNALLQHAELKVLGAASHEWTAHDLVFTTRTGRPVEPRNLARSFHRIVGSHGLRPIRLHSLRRTTATLLKDLGRPASGHDGDPRPCPDRRHDGGLHRGRRG